VKKRTEKILTQRTQRKSAEYAEKNGKEIEKRNPSVLA
jgi:hypothetical protein